HPFPAQDSDDDLEYKSSKDEKVRHYLRANGRELLQGPLMDTGYRCGIHCMSGEGKCDQKCHVNSVTDETSCADGHLPGICQHCCYDYDPYFNNKYLNNKYWKNNKYFHDPHDEYLYNKYLKNNKYLHDPHAYMYYNNKYWKNKNKYWKKNYLYHDPYADKFIKNKHYYYYYP
ncbi:hypothetical protein ACHAWC_011943, partial [Mediolabrus comicus]